MMTSDFPLDRPEIVPDLRLAKDYIKGRRVMVTGGGGSIGSELCRQIINCNPEKLLVLGRGENSIFEIASELSEANVKVKIDVIIADVRDCSKVDRVYEVYNPQIVFHAAAHKHVPLMEQHPDEAVKNNIFGTLNVARAALEKDTEVFVMISSDKAVNPTSVLGATKKAAEYIVRDLANRGDTRFVVVRFGNVIRSRGSIIPIFERQIISGGPLTVTHPEMKRYFMSIPEAAYLVLQSGAVAETGQTMVLDMGDPVKIIDIVHGLIKKAGLLPGTDIEIKYTEPRPGDKLTEELTASKGGMKLTAWEKILLDESEEIDTANLHDRLHSLKESLLTFDDSQIIAQLQRLVPSYNRQTPNSSDMASAIGIP